MIERHEGLMQVTCDSCPASFPETFAEEDFTAMIAEVRAAGWEIRKVIDAGARDCDTRDLFGSASNIAGAAKAQPYTHTCTACAKATIERGRLL